MIVALLAQEGSYIASESSLYRVLRKNQLLSHRQESKAPRKGKQPDRIEVTGPNQVWSWDITWLKTEVKGLFFYAYTVIDVYDRSIVGWTIEDQESDYHAHRLFSRIIRDLKVHPEVIHSDNGNPMRGMTLAAFLDSLFITRSYSRPRVSNDNPFIESWHKTLKYSVGYPDTFPSIEEARVWYANFINWYNTEHLHSALGYVTPEQKRSGKSEELYSKRNETIALAHLTNPDRWRTGKVKVYGSLPVKTVYRPLSKIA
jgi:transposase InsO family protein